MANGEDPDEMSQNVAFYQDLCRLLRHTRYSKKETIFFWKIITSTCNPSIYKKDHPDLTISTLWKNPIRVKCI